MRWYRVDLWSVTAPAALASLFKTMTLIPIQLLEADIAPSRRLLKGIRKMGARMTRSRNFTECAPGCVAASPPPPLPVSVFCAVRTLNTERRLRVRARALSRTGRAIVFVRFDINGRMAGAVRCARAGAMRTGSATTSAILVRERASVRGVQAKRNAILTCTLYLHGVQRDGVPLRQGQRVGCSL